MLGTTRRTSRLLYAAAAAGLVHAGFSLYWAIGGRFLLETVGRWAVDLADGSPVLAGAGLGGVAVAKTAGAIIPVVVEQRPEQMPGRRWWRLLEWAGAGVLLAYGLTNTAVSSAVLAGIIDPADGYDRSAQLGHALLWDPLFALWGLLLGLGLWRTRG